MILEILEVDDLNAPLKDSTRLREDLGLDSLQLAQLTVEVEDRFDVDIFEDGMVETVGDIIAKVKDN
jgi:acyl carrier protein